MNKKQIETKLEETFSAFMGEETLLEDVSATQK